MDMITGVIVGIVIALAISVLITLILPRQKRDPDSYGRQQWHFEDDDK